ncbi:ribosomal protein S18-alanine N-acetyltransferase [Anaerolineales bacterium HSG6]|nr:ribosomal protein S18-alanine N-acetyltransferase [Anaerolineales bacterium HSG6]
MVITVEQAAYQNHWSRQDYTRELEQPNLAQNYLLTMNSQIIGVGGFWALADEAHITTVSINPTWQGQQLGDWLLFYLLSQARYSSLRLATLEIRASNHRAMRLYQKYQFNIVGERPKYYPDGEMALILTTPPINTPDYQTFMQNRGCIIKQQLAKKYSTGELYHEQPIF